MKKDLDSLALFEKAIKEKYGPDAIQNPKKFWDKEKEKKYLDDLKGFYSRKKEKREKRPLDGFLVSEKLILKESDRSCSVCKVYSFDVKDDLYMNRYSCCFGCYISHVEGREERWNNGWRPKK